jgi:hypothetical protein
MILNKNHTSRWREDKTRVTETQGRCVVVVNQGKHKNNRL